MQLEESISNKLKELDLEEKIYLNSNIFEYSFKNNNIFMKNNICKKPFHIYLRKHSRFIHFPNHKHDYIELTYVISGSITHIINNQKITLNEDEVLLLNVNTYHEILPCKDEDIALNFIISIDYLNSILNYVSDNNELSKFISHQFMADKTYQETFVFTNLSDDVKAIFKILINHFFNNDSQEKVNTLFAYILTHLFTNNIHKQYYSYHYKPEKVKLDIKTYIDNFYLEGSLTELSKQLNISYSHLSTIIKKEFGSCYKDIIQNKKLSIAHELVIKSDIPIKDVAAFIGYENLTFFYKIFKKKYSTTPSVLRKDYCQKV